MIPASTSYRLPAGTTAQRPTLGVGDAGVVYFDTTLGRPIDWDGTTWLTGQTDDVFPPTVWALFDDFLGQSTETGEIGDKGWSFTNGTIALQAAVAGRPGIFRRTSGAVINQVASMALAGTANVAQFVFGEWDEAIFGVSIPTTGGFTARFGVMADFTANPSTNGVWIETLSTDTQWFGVSRSAGVQSRSTALGTVDTGWHHFRCARVDATTVEFTVDTTTAQLTANIPVAATGLAVGLQIIPSAAAARSFDLDYAGVAGTLGTARWTP